MSQRTTSEDQYAASTQPQPVRPRLALRVGVTGTRAMPDEPTAQNHVASAIRAALEALRKHTFEAAAKPNIAAPHEPDVQPLLRLVSPLAEGADRLVARIAIELGYQLEVPMPFPQGEYERDFQPKDRDARINAASLAEFHDLLSHAVPDSDAGPKRILELDGGRGDDEAASYGAVGRLVVRNCDLLIAVWNGRPGKGSGGTADTVRFAARGGPPVWWVDAEGKLPPRWVEGLATLRRPQNLPSGADALVELHRYLEGMVTPPQSAHLPGEGVLGRLFRRDTAPLQCFLGERLPLGHASVNWLWRSERTVMGLAQRAGERLEHWLNAAHRLFGGIGPSPHEAKLAVSTPRTDAPAALPGARAAEYWHRFYAAPDGLATAYAARYRSSYAMIAVLAALAVMAGNLAVVWGGSAKLPLTLLEFAALALLIWLVAANQRRYWHGRWIAYWPHRWAISMIWRRRWQHERAT